MSGNVDEPEPWRVRLSSTHVAQLGAVWGKSDAAGTVNLLLQHLLDTMAVGELLWDRYLAPGLRWRLDEVAGGDGRRFFAWLCGIHDVGKATPAFQTYVPELARHVSESGLVHQVPRRADRQRWRHDTAGGRVAWDALLAAWDPDDDLADGGHVGWIWPLVAGHHGSVPRIGVLGQVKGALHAPSPAWTAVQQCLLEVVTQAAGYSSIEDAEPARRPSRADQLLVSGLIVMADWIASDEQHFDGVDTLDGITSAGARRRAERAWGALQLKGGWGQLAEPLGDVVQTRFGVPARPSQTMVIDAVRQMAAPGLVIVEAPMGEGKTESALAAAEVLAARFGADGIFVGMPTQATSDPMFSRVLEWSRSFDLDLPVALLHGKRLFNPDWKRLVARQRERTARSAHDVDEVDEFGIVDLPPPIYRGVCEDGLGDDCGNEAPAEWYLGRKRGLLAPFVVGTIDQLLFAATRTRHVMLRYAGLAGKVVILDEVHAADVYMSQFLGEALAWLGQGKVPVVLLSATLAPGQRRELVTSYLSGALDQADVQLRDLEPANGYPSVTTACAVEGSEQIVVQSTEPWRASLHVGVEVLDEAPTDGMVPVVEAIRRELHEGGCALIIRNTVDRAQQTFEALEPLLGSDVRLLHARFSSADRAERTADLLRLLGADGDEGRPKRLVLVATQLAEQSFDIDVDLVISDLAPVDLLLQRAGRLHRHDRPREARPSRLRVPRLLVTGVSFEHGVVPWMPGGSEAVYGRHLLLRTALQVRSAAAAGGWSVPADVPRLVAATYADEVDLPDEWVGDAEKAEGLWRTEQTKRRDSAQDFLLSGRRERTKPTLEGLHTGGSRSSDVETQVRVRDGDSSIEVVLLREHEDGTYLALDGTRLGPHGEQRWDDPLIVLGGTVRLPAHPPAVTAAASGLKTLPAWQDHPWLRYARVLCLDSAGCAELEGWVVRYDTRLGLQVDRS